MKKTKRRRRDSARGRSTAQHSPSVPAGPDATDNDRQLRRLAALERKKLQDAYKETKVEIKQLRALLDSPQLMRQEIEDELTAVKTQYNTPRLTQIIDTADDKVVRISDDSVSCFNQRYIQIMKKNIGQQRTDYRTLGSSLAR